MKTSNRPGRVYEIKSYQDHLGVPCKLCGVALTASNQSKGWRGMCKVCRQDARYAGMYPSTCVICDKVDGSVRDNRCNSCRKDFTAHHNT